MACRTTLTPLETESLTRSDPCSEANHTSASPRVQCKDKKSEEIANIDGWEYASKDKNETAMAVLHHHLFVLTLAPTC